MKRYYSQNSMAVNNPKLTVKIFAFKKINRIYCIQNLWICQDLIFQETSTRPSRLWFLKLCSVQIWRLPQIHRQLEEKAPCQTYAIGGKQRLHSQQGCITRASVCSTEVTHSCCKTCQRSGSIWQNANMDLQQRIQAGYGYCSQGQGVERQVFLVTLKQI